MLQRAANRTRYPCLQLCCKVACHTLKELLFHRIVFRLLYLIILLVGLLCLLFQSGTICLRLPNRCKLLLQLLQNLQRLLFLHHFCLGALQFRCTGCMLFYFFLQHCTSLLDLFERCLFLCLLLLELLALLP